MMLITRRLTSLLILLLLALTPMVYLYITSNSYENDKKNKFFPELLSKPDQITKIVIQRENQRITFKKDTNQWYIEEKNQYPAIGSNVEALLYGLADLKVIEKKTTNPAYYAKLGVNDTNDANSNSTLVSVYDIYNDAIAKVYIGTKEPVYLGEDYSEHIFVRNYDEQQTWLVQGTISIPTQLKDWVEQPLLSIVDEEDIKSVELSHADKNIKIAKSTSSLEDFNLEGIDETNANNLDVDSINTVPFEIAELEFKDVINADDITSTKEDLLHAKVEMFNGVVVNLELYKHKEKILAKVHADASDASNRMKNKVALFNHERTRWLYEITDKTYESLALQNEDFYIRQKHN